MISTVNIQITPKLNEEDMPLVSEWLQTKYCNLKGVTV